MKETLIKLYKKYMGEQLPIRIRFFNICCFGAVFSSILASLAAISSGAQLPGILSSLSTVFLFLIIFIVAQVSKKYDACIIACIYSLNFLCFPALYFTVGGIEGGMPLYFVVGIVFTALMMRGVLMVITLILEYAFYSYLFYFTYTHPGFVESIFDIGDLSSRDVALDLIVVSICIGALVKILSILFENERKHTGDLLQKLEDLSVRDPLTGVYNRRFLLTYLEDGMEKNRLQDTPVSIIMFDIDKFKLLNDDYGHLVGDEVLKNLAALLMDNCRSYDIVARYGGEEFIIVLPNATKEVAYKRAEQIRKKIEASCFSNAVNRPVTVSGGVAAYHKKINTTEELIAIADKNLYAAKENGRNKVVKLEEGETEDNGSEPV